MESKRNYERTLYASDKNDIDIALAVGLGKPGTPTKGQSVTPYNWQSGMHRVKFEGGKLREIRIYPVDARAFAARPRVDVPEGSV